MSAEGYFTECDDVLENKLGIVDPDEMRAVEADVVSLHMSELIAEPPPGEMNFNYLKRIHRKLFSDIYPMAGKIRSVEIAKGNSVFCYARFIEDEQRRIFGEMGERFREEHPARDDFAAALARLSADLNALHPFREGNGWAIRVFLILLAMRHGYSLDFDSASIEAVHRADIAGFHGDLTELKELYQRILTDGD